MILLILLNLFFSDTERINQIIDELDNALIARNALALENYYSDDIQLVAPNGFVLNKQQLIAPFKKDKQAGNLKSISTTDRQIRLYENTAVVLLKTTHFFKDNSTTSYKNSLVFIKEKSGWKLTLMHGTILEKK